MHGLIHDGRLRACQSCLFKLMYIFILLYVIRCFNVMACLGFQLVDDYIKGQVLPFSCYFFLKFLCQGEFPPYLILKKTAFCHLMLKAADFSQL